MKNRFIVIAVVMQIVVVNVGCKKAETSTVVTSTLYEGIEFDMPIIEEPVFPDYVSSITDFNAIGNGLVDNSEAINNTIIHVSENGGGHVIVPRGIWKTGPIALMSNIDLHLEEGALIVFDSDLSKYPLISTSFEGLQTYRCVSPISGFNLQNIAITGRGVIDGAGEGWRPVKKAKMTAAQWNKLVSSGGVLSEDQKTWYPSEQSRKGDTTGNFNVPDFNSREEHEAIKDFLRPVMLSLVKCKNVLLDGPTFQNSPAWNIHPLMCENVIIRNLTVRNPWYSQNGDGVDLESCKNVLIHSNTFDVGDDAICFKSGKDDDGIKRGIPTENVIVKDNIVYHGHGGFVIGSEMSGGIKNVHVSHCTFIGTDCGLRFKSTRGRGGVVENIYISDINMINIEAEAIRFNLYYGGESPVAMDGTIGKASVDQEIVPVSITTPSFQNIYIKNIQATGCGIAGFFQGLPEMKLKNIQLVNILIEAKYGMTLIDADQISFENVEIIQQQGAAINAFNVNDLKVNHSKFVNLDSVVVINGTESKKINFSESNISLSNLKIGEDVSRNEVVIQ